MKKHFAAACRGGAIAAVALMVCQSSLSHAAPNSAGSSQIENGAPAIPIRAVISADGRRAIWTDKDQSGFWAAERESVARPWGVPEHVVSVRGVVRSAVFSPDGQKLAFENVRGGDATGGYGASRRFEWAFIGVFDFSTGRLAYLDPSFGRDAQPQWSTDGKQISYWRQMDGLPARRIATAVPQIDEGSTRPRSDAAPVVAFLGAPLVYQPAVSGDGRSFAFVAREGRARSIYFGRLGASPSRLIQYGDDDGQEISDLALSHDGNLVAYVRGGAPNAKGEIPNPRLLTSPPRRQLWVIDRASGRQQLVGEGAQPQFSPDGKRLIWVSDQAVMSAELGGMTTGHLVAEPLLAGSASTLRFSPDGARLSFERAGYIEILDLASGNLRALPRPAEANDAGPIWSPDGAQIAFRRTLGSQPPRLGDGYAGQFVAKQPWEIWTADAATGQSRRVWQAAPGIGSAWYALDQDPTGTGTIADQILWSSTGSFIFMSERDGWRHLYSVSAEGGEPFLLTPGEGEVETAALSRDGRSVFYSTNIGDLARRHIMRVPVAGGKPERLTPASSSQWAPTPLADGALAYIDAGWALPPRVVVRHDNGQSATLQVPAIPASFRSARLVEPRPVEFPGTDGQTAYGQLFTPRQSRGCGVIFVHGGIRRQMLPGFHYMDAYSHLYELNQYLVSQGCAVLSVEYRSSIMRGYAFRNAPDWGSAGASEYKDVLGAASFLRSHKRLGIDRVGIYGLSWGGYLTAQALARNSDLFAVGFDMAGVHEFTGKRFENSPAAFVDQWRSPVYLAAGDDDRNVDFNQAVMLAQALRTRRPDVELVEHVVPNETHDLYLTFDHLVSVYQAGADFLLRHLQRPLAASDR
jgi:dipeptidyl aminopeptidase/acylaminoacyl peptidase